MKLILLFLFALLAATTAESSFDAPDGFVDVDYIDSVAETEDSASSMQTDSRQLGRGRGGGGHRGKEKNYTNITCAAEEEEIACGRSWYNSTRTGTVVCRTKTSRHGNTYNWTTCMADDKAYVNDTCGCCDGMCAAIDCGCACNITKRGEVVSQDGVLLERQRGSRTRQVCVTQEYGVTLQVLDQPFSCVTTCPP